jgi:hypothetical protein
MSFLPWLAYVTIDTGVERERVTLGIVAPALAGELVEHVIVAVGASPAPDPSVPLTGA